MKLEPGKLLLAAVPVVVGLVLFNNVKRVAGNTVIGKVMDGSLLRSA